MITTKANYRATTTNPQRPPHPVWFELETRQKLGVSDRTASLCGGTLGGAEGSLIRETEWTFVAVVQSR